MSEKLGIVGSGQIACGIAVVGGANGIDVVLRARSDESAAKAQASIEKQCGRLDDPAAALANIKVITEIAELADRSFVIEAVSEEYDAKQPLLEEIGKVVGPDCAIGSTTSSLSVEKLAGFAGHADRFVGFHVFNPVPVMKLIEIVYASATTDEVKARSRALCEALGKTGVEVPDTPGFVVNRLLFPYLFDCAAFMAEHNLTPEAVDTCMKLGAGYPMGPLALLDYVGMDVSIAIGESIGCEIPQNCRELLEQGKLGRKSGEGFYNYAK